MTANNFIKYYRKNITPRHLVYKYMKRRFLLSLIAAAILLLGILASFGYIVTNLKNQWSILGLIFLILCIVYLVKIKNGFYNKVSLILQKHYGIKSCGRLWNTVEYQTYVRHLIINYLMSNNLYVPSDQQLTKEKLSELMESLEKEKVKWKFPPYIAPGLLIAFFVPNWIEFLKFQYALIKVDDLSSAFRHFISISVVIVIVCLICGFFKRAFDDFYAHINQTHVINDIIYILQDIKLYYPEEINVDRVSNSSGLEDHSLIKDRPSSISM